MKPRDWGTLRAAQKRQAALDLFGSPRGMYLLSQALHYGIKALRAVAPVERREVSNIEDMEMLRETLFNFPIFDDETMVPPSTEAAETKS